MIGLCERRGKCQTVYTAVNECVLLAIGVLNTSLNIHSYAHKAIHAFMRKGHSM